MTARALPGDPMEVKADEYGLLRVFAMDRDDRKTPAEIGALIGAEVDASKIEVADTKSVAGLGLATYLAEGYGIAPADLRDHAEALDAIDGHVALIPTSAFQKQTVRLEPKPPLRFVGIFAEAAGKPATNMARREASEGTLPTPEAPAEPPGRSPRPTWPLFLIALLIAAALVLFAVL